MSRVKCDSAVMFEFIISLVFIFRGVIIITSAHNCSQYSIQGFSYCTEDVEIKYPFWYDYGSSDVSGYHCGYPGFGIKCVDRDGNILKDVNLEHISTTVMNIFNKLYHPSNIQYEGKSLRVKEMGIQGEECPHPRRNLSLQEFGPSLSDRYGIKWILFYNCSNPPDNYSYFEQYHLSCLDNSGRRSYAFRGRIPPYDGFNWYKNCEQTLMAPSRSMTAQYGLFNQAEDNYTTAVKEGFVLGWSAPIGDCKDCENSGGLCSYNRNGGFRKCSCESHFWNDFDKTCPPLHKKGLSSGVKVLIGVFTGLGTLLVVLLLTYITYKKSNCKRSSKVETFLESCENLALQRYKYSDIKKMTNSFKETLGKGGYGCVFKGKLMRDGRLVAIKMLNESKGNGEDFMNEVATIGRTNHVNVVSLLGFCTEGTKRALVYEFMQNGSLERFIYNEKTSSTPLGWEKLYQIALGIARGLEYLHRGCNTRILHFDIKPHNILLDHEFCPKISDFGLAKLCPTRESVVSMLDARGTIGYIAPEVYCRNFGGVSHKSDVYSYGMMVFEIIGGRKNIDPTVENISEIYFPQWIYNHLIKQDTNVEGSGDILADETTKKMIIVASWCVQIQPADRPSISKVVEMLEGSTKDLQMPPNPFQDPPSRSSP